MDLGAASQEFLGIVAVTCDGKTYLAFLKFRLRVIKIARGLRKNLNAYDDSKEELAALLDTARAAIRKELGIEQQE
jgi:hypothetical protein